MGKPSGFRAHCSLEPSGSEQEPAKSAISKPGSEKDVALVAKGYRTNRGDELIKLTIPK